MGRKQHKRLEVRRTHSALGTIRGEKNENRAFDSVGVYVSEARKRKHDSLPWLLKIRRALPEENNAGVDLVLVTSKGPIGIQVKSSSRYIEKHRQSYPNIPAVVVEEGKTDEEIAEEILQTVYDHFIKGSNKTGRNYVRRF